MSLLRTLKDTSNSHVSCSSTPYWALRYFWKTEICTALKLRQQKMWSGDYSHLGCWIIACSLGWSSQSSNLQSANISNRPLCILIHSLASNREQKHQHFNKGHSPTEKHFAQEPQIPSTSVYICNNISLDLVWLAISTLFDRPCKFLLSLQNVFLFEAALLSDQSREKKQGIQKETSIWKVYILSVWSLVSNTDIQY